MPRQQVEFEFPDPDKEDNTQEVEVDIVEEDAPLEVEGAVGREDMKSAKDTIKAGEVEIEVEDDTPPEDRGRKPSEPPQDVTDEELENYSEKVKSRIKHFSKGYHDERRAKETAQREREALEAYAKQLVEENQRLTGTVSKNQTTMLEQAKQTVAKELEEAKRKYKEAYEAGDSDALVEAQDAIATAKIRADKVANFKPAPLQTTETPVKVPQQPIETQALRDERAVSWADENPWFGSDDEMTAFALGLDSKLKKGGVDPQSDEYYEKINSRMRQVFPDQFDDGIEDEPEAPKQKSSNVVAPATRSTGPKKIRLTQSQIAIAKKLGVPLETYAKQAAELMRKQ
ncbi:hypothetical protein N9350_01320 [Gammaproteobacteria bacterium]|nr:hypothetical protein [Gammaproteobacteria bacterium]